MKQSVHNLRSIVDVCERDIILVRSREWSTKLVRFYRRWAVIDGKAVVRAVTSNTEIPILLCRGFVLPAPSTRTVRYFSCGRGDYDYVLRNCTGLSCSILLALYFSTARRFGRICTMSRPPSIHEKFVSVF